MSKVRGIRGAVTVKKNTKEEILSSTAELLRGMVKANNIRIDDIAGVIFTVTKDLNAEFPALAARRKGWIYTPLICTNEIDVPGSVKKCIRILMLVNSGKSQSSIKNIYIGGAKKLRPDIR